MKKLIIIGYGGHARVVKDIALATKEYEIFGFLDDNKCIDNNVLGKINDYKKYISTSVFFVAIGNNKQRLKIQKMIMENGAEVISLIYPSSIIGSSVTIGRGVVVMPGTVINTGSIIEDGVIINTCSSVDHDCVIHEYSHISVGAHLAGNVKVGSESFICAGVTVINNVNIACNSTIGAGATVIKDINESGVFCGTPANRKK